jgi:lipopolysaccharide transport system ATP-binding protein
MKPSISVRKLSKQYTLGEGAEYGTLRESIMNALGGPVRRLRGGRGKAPAPAARSNELWALRGVSLDISPGEVVGLIGRNGAGKSTLLKILSRITAPTAGSVEIRGKVGSLLEVGTGFHPELSGRDNIYLNGAILGMTRSEVSRKFDEIVGFSELERFLETPVKRYSSGMYTRLAFAVASHLETEVLMVDEVLAVGDAAFQSKCLGKMGEVSRSGRTVIFVSHNMSAIKALCTRAVLIEAGRLAVDGGVDEVVNRYLTAGTDMSRTGVIPADAPRHTDAKGEGRIQSVRLTDLHGRDINQLYFGQPFRIGVTFETFKDVDDGHIEISISGQDGTHVTYTTTLDGGRESLFVPEGTHEVWADFSTTLLPRDYTIDLGLHRQGGTTIDFVQRTYDFTVLPVAQAGTDHYRWKRTRGYVRAEATWDLRALAAAAADQRSES